MLRRDIVLFQGFGIVTARASACGISCCHQTHRLNSSWRAVRKCRPLEWLEHFPSHQKLFYLSSMQVVTIYLKLLLIHQVISLVYKTSFSCRRTKWQQGTGFYCIYDIKTCVYRSLFKWGYSNARGATIISYPRLYFWIHPSAILFINIHKAFIQSTFICII